MDISQENWIVQRSIKMLARKIAIVKCLVHFESYMGSHLTIGEVSRHTKIPRSTVRRLLISLENTYHVKSTASKVRGKDCWKFEATVAGYGLANSQRSMF